MNNYDNDNDSDIAMIKIEKYQKNIYTEWLPPF